ncbi:MAG: hypothetical protein RL033_3167, partial [Pseudomonadota bacterium]
MRGRSSEIRVRARTVLVRTVLARTVLAAAVPALAACGSDGS